MLGLDYAAQLNPLLLVISVLLFVAKGFALVDCVARPSSQFTQAETLPKGGWAVILVLAVLTHAITSHWNPLGLTNLVGTVAALVYLAQLRGSSL